MHISNIIFTTTLISIPFVTSNPLFSRSASEKTDISSRSASHVLTKRDAWTVNSDGPLSSDANHLNPITVNVPEGDKDFNGRDGGPGDVQWWLGNQIQKARERATAAGYHLTGRSDKDIIVNIVAQVYASSVEGWNVVITKDITSADDNTAYAYIGDPNHRDGLVASASNIKIYNGVYTLYVFRTGTIGRQLTLAPSPDDNGFLNWAWIISSSGGVTCGTDPAGSDADTISAIHCLNS